MTELTLQERLLQAADAVPNIFEDVPAPLSSPLPGADSKVFDNPSDTTALKAEALLDKQTNCLAQLHFNGSETIAGICRGVVCGRAVVEITNLYTAFRPLDCITAISLPKIAVK